MKKNIISRKEIAQAAFSIVVVASLAAFVSPAPKRTPALNGDTLPPIMWNDTAALLVESGAISPEKLESAMGELSAQQLAVLRGEYRGKMDISDENAYFLLNVLWALGIANKSTVLSDGPMGSFEDSAYLASTGGWTVGRDGAGDFYLNKHGILELTPAESALVYGVAENTYRPCCDNPTLFPDCNHGAALLGALQMAASQGYTEDELYELAFVLNSLWFPEQYAAIVEKNPGISAREALSAKYSSYSGWQENVAAKIEGGASCAV